MALLYFIWNGTNSNTKHIRVQAKAPIIRPEERVEHVTIPGRAGELTQVEGEHIYNSYIQTLTLIVDGKANVPAAEEWLTGEGYVTFDTQPTLQQRARIINAVTFSKHSHNLDYWVGDVQFYCEPVKGLIAEEDIEVTTSGETLTNPGTLPAFPEIQMEGSGAVSIQIDGKTLVIPSLTSGWTADCANRWICLNGTPQWNAWTGDFPQIPVGTSSILFTGSITKLTITPHWRYL